MKDFEDRINQLYEDVTFTDESSGVVRLKENIFPPKLCQDYYGLILEQFSKIIAHGKTASHAFGRLSLLIHPDKKKIPILFFDTFLKEGEQKISFDYLTMLREYGKIIADVSLEDWLSEYHSRYSALPEEGALPEAQLKNLIAYLEEKCDAELNAQQNLWSGSETLGQIAYARSEPFDYAISARLFAACFQNPESWEKKTYDRLDQALKQKGGLAKVMEDTIQSVYQRHYLAELIPEIQPVDDLQELILVLRKNSENAPDISSKIMWESLANLTEAMKKHIDNVEALPSRWLQQLIGAIPFVTAGATVGVFMPGFILSMTLIKSINYYLLNEGRLDASSVSGALETFLFLSLKFTENLGISVLSTVFTVNFKLFNLLYATQELLLGLTGTDTASAHALEPSFSHALLGDMFEKINTYIKAQENDQFFSGYRTGNKKVKTFQNTLSRLRAIDTIENDALRATAIDTEVARLENNALLNGSGRGAINLIKNLREMLGTSEKNTDSCAYAPA